MGGSTNLISRGKLQLAKAMARPKSEKKGIQGVVLGTCPTSKSNYRQKGYSVLISTRAQQIEKNFFTILQLP